MDFLQRAKDTLAIKGKDAVDKTKEIAEVTRLTGQLHSLESKREKAYAALGRKVYDTGNNCGDESIDAYFTDILFISRNIEVTNAEILKLKGLVECKNCGAYVDFDSAFCPKCGSQIEKPKEEVANGDVVDIGETEVDSCVSECHCDGECEHGCACEGNCSCESDEDSSVE